MEREMISREDWEREGQTFWNGEDLQRGGRNEIGEECYVLYEGVK